MGRSREVLGTPQSSGDTRFLTHAERMANHDEVDTLITSRTGSMDREDLLARLLEQRVIAGPVLDDRDAFEDPHLRARGYFVMEEQAECGRHLYPGFPYRFTETPLRVRSGPVRLGEDNDYVYRTLLHYSDDEYRALQEAGHIGMDFAPHIR